MPSSASELALKKGSKSFYAASRLLHPSLQLPVTRLYAWCRECDDRIDAAGLSQHERKVELDRLNRMTLEAVTGEILGETVFSEFGQVARDYRIPEYYWRELLAGMDMDASGSTYADLSNLELYCFRVAGTVGLMMTHLLGISDQSALENASDLGIGMQMSNIARDVLDDARLGRVYLPALWLEAEGMNHSAESVLAPANRAALARVVARLIALAEVRYLSGLKGTRYLPWRAALAIRAASLIYRSIGRKVVAKGEKAWDQRVFVTPIEMTLYIARAIGWLVFRSLPNRCLIARTSVPITNVWRHE